MLPHVPSIDHKDAVKDAIRKLGIASDALDEGDNSAALKILTELKIPVDGNLDSIVSEAKKGLLKKLSDDDSKDTFAEDSKEVNLPRSIRRYVPEQNEGFIYGLIRSHREFGLHVCKELHAFEEDPARDVNVLYLENCYDGHSKNSKMTSFGKVGLYFLIANEKLLCIEVKINKSKRACNKRLLSEDAFSTLDFSNNFQVTLSVTDVASNTKVANFGYSPHFNIESTKKPFQAKHEFDGNYLADLIQRYSKLDPSEGQVTPAELAAEVKAHKRYLPELNFMVSLSRLPLSKAFIRVIEESNLKSFCETLAEPERLAVLLESFSRSEDFGDFQYCSSSVSARSMPFSGKSRS